jgi:hypothetical protein
LSSTITKSPRSNRPKKPEKIIDVNFWRKFVGLLSSGTPLAMTSGGDPAVSIAGAVSDIENDPTPCFEHPHRTSIRLALPAHWETGEFLKRYIDRRRLGRRAS